MPQPDFPEGVALVVGGSGGLGGAIVAALARAGCAVAAGWRSNADAVDALITARESGDGAIEGVRIDATDPISIDAAMAASVARFGRLHTVVFAAGPVPTQAYLAAIEPAAWRRAIEVETVGFLSVVRAALPYLRAGTDGAGGGSIVHLGSAADRLWAARDGLSVVPKAANEALVRGIAREEGRYGVRANSVLVGVVEFGMFLKLRADGEFGDDWAAVARRATPLGRFGTADEVADAVVFLASARASYVTGQQIAVAGGYGV